jgi:phosphoglycolate phosphatase-like HAD superfamily hydrolase
VILVIFDIDGTLTDTNADDDRLFLEALRETSGIADPIEPWETFGEVTDPAIVREVYSRNLGRRAREIEIAQVRGAFLRKWHEGLESGDLTVTPMPGAREIVEEVRSQKGHVAALATGGWGPTALMKLTAAQFPVDDLVLATADDAEIRSHIVRTASIFAAAGAAIPGFSQIVCVGDGVWDARTAKQVGAGFIGITNDPEKAIRLTSEGAVATLPDFRSADDFWAAVDKAVQRGQSAPGN